MCMCVCVCGRSPVSLHTGARALRGGLARASSPCMARQAREPLCACGRRPARPNMDEASVEFLWSTRTFLTAAGGEWSAVCGWYGGEGVYKDPGGRCPSPPTQLEPAAVKVSSPKAGDKQQVSGAQPRVGPVDGGKERVRINWV